jgi:uncharacterized OB-fold protein
MNPAQLPTVAPSVDAETKPFWDATQAGTLLLKRCRSCESVFWYPRTMCPVCGSLDTEWTEASGRGSVHSFTIVRRGGPGVYQDAVPYVLAYVELDEGPRVLTNIVDCDPDAVRIGDGVSVVFHAAGPDAALVRFRPLNE